LLSTSPVKYRNALRVERAKELLRDGSFSVAEAAYASGFENIGYFCRTYRNFMGEAPGDTKKEIRLRRDTPSKMEGRSTKRLPSFFLFSCQIGGNMI